jgi:hypothetical protein
MTSFAIVGYNHRTYRSGGVVAVVGGQAAAEKLLQEFERSLDEKDRHAGWRYFLEETDLAAGTEADKATRFRQARLDRRRKNTLCESGRKTTRARGQRKRPLGQRGVSE